MNDLHPGDIVLSAVLRLLPSVYGAAQAKTEQRLRAFLKPRLAALQRHENESPEDYRDRLLAAFRGPRWTLVKHSIAADFFQANSRATEYINSNLEQAFMAGFNESAYVLSGMGVDMLPMTVAVVGTLAADGLLKLQKRRMKKGKDTAYNAKRADTAVKNAVLQGLTPEEIPGHASRIMAKHRYEEMVAAARAYIYGASDEGAYYAGIEAEKQGLDVEKTWLAIMDMRVRPSHKHLHGTTVPIDTPFMSYHGPMRFPHDPKGHPAEIYRCRCRMAVHLAGKSPGEYSRRLLPTQTSEYRRWRDAQIRRFGSELELARIHWQRLKAG